MGKVFSYVYMAEFNRCVGDNIALVIRRLQKQGYEVARIRHKTTLLIRRPAGSKFAKFRIDLMEQVQPRIGSLVLASTSGKFWLLDNTGNKPGIMVRVGIDDV